MIEADVERLKRDQTWVTGWAEPGTQWRRSLSLCSVSMQLLTQYLDQSMGNRIVALH